MQRPGDRRSGGAGGAGRG
ncbi:hypothetical protein M9C64_30030, partial [Pseudomonas aeruginosa]